MVYFLLFKSNDDKLKNDNLGCHPSYINEKFDQFFTRIPTTRKDHLINLHHNDKDLWNRGTEYIVHWKLNQDRFINSDDYSRWFFTFFLMHSKKDARNVMSRYPDYPNHFKNIKFLLMKYKRFFNSYDFISEDKLNHLLHPLLREQHEKMVYEHRYVFRSIALKNLTR